MFAIKLCAALALLSIASAASAERIKRPAPDADERARMALDHAMNDGSLQPGDIITTPKGFLRFRGITNEGSYEFEPVRDPTYQEQTRKKN
jgi:DMSO/TMAO reductase YedYZ molybdopterin-dependent catalytic subunit